jgi:hypothetical protein
MTDFEKMSKASEIAAFSYIHICTWLRYDCYRCMMSIKMRTTRMFEHHDSRPENFNWILLPLGQVSFNCEDMHDVRPLWSCSWTMRVGQYELLDTSWDLNIRVQETATDSSNVIYLWEALSLRVRSSFLVSKDLSALFYCVRAAINVRNRTSDIILLSDILRMRICKQFCFIDVSVAAAERIEAPTDDVITNLSLPLGKYQFTDSLDLHAFVDKWTAIEQSWMRRDWSNRTR